MGNLDGPDDLSMVSRVLDLLNRWLRRLDPEGTVERAAAPNRMFFPPVRPAFPDDQDESLLSKLSEAQTCAAEGGAVALVVRIMVSAVSVEVLEQAFELAIAMLDRGNSKVQQLFLECMVREDQEMCRVLAEIHKNILQSAPRFRRIRKHVISMHGKFDRSALAGEDEQRIDRCTEDANLIMRVQRFIQLLCEGQNSVCQNYLRHQTEKAVSFDMIAITCDVISNLCETVDHVEILDVHLIETTSACFNFLIEVVQGPNLENQKKVAHHGILERVMNIIKADFARVSEELGGDDPPEIRALRMSCVQLLTSLIEGGADMEVMTLICNRLDHDALMYRLVVTVSSMKQYLAGYWSRPLEALALQMSNDECEERFGEAYGIVILFLSLSEADETVLNCPPKLADIWQGKLPPAEPDMPSTPQEAFEFLRHQIRSVEVVLDGRLARIWFRKPLVCAWIRPSAREEIIGSCDQEGVNLHQKHGLFIGAIEELTIHVANAFRLSQLCFVARKNPLNKFAPTLINRPFHFFLRRNARNLTILYNLRHVLAMTLCFLVSATLSPKDTVSGVHIGLQMHNFEVMGVDVDAEWVTMYLGVVYAFLTAITLIMNCCLHIPGIYQVEATSLKRYVNPGSWETGLWIGASFGSAGVALVYSGILPCLMVLLGMFRFVDGSWRDAQATGEDVPNNVAAIALRSISRAFALEAVASVSFFWVLVMVALARGQGFEFLYAFLVFDAVFQIEVLRNVLQAVVTPAKQLVLTGFLILLILYGFSLIAMFAFGDIFIAFPLEGAPVTATFFMNTVYDLMLPGTVIAVTENHPQTLMFRFMFDITFWTIFSVVLLNIIFGIIVDTFSALRTDAQRRADRARGFCFICDLSLNTIEAAMAAGRGSTGSGFVIHINEEHSVWDYIYFIFYIKGKDPTQYTGAEHILRSQIDHADVGWLPYTRALCQERLVGDAAEEVAVEDRVASLESMVSDMSKNVETLLLEFLRSTKKQPAR
eukprot:CAMPEP_0204370556 /NCGR_PEP_ID=MMETSP0469-20131031/45822_1 /ASSEMBLY_ACC=CAM_ASM_000384 /TAXON_ID=2969 /ORGANISM="Oxyrrhis marina" /LENGTH=992 /DNA_ID=CAMNT_0051360491 /DNA_START=18 /DNA_END=2996 /DNA_ORIENTATION=-